MLKWKLTLLSMAAMMLMAGGCQSNAVTPEQAKAVGEQIETLTDQITKYQAQVSMVAEKLEKTGVIDSNDAAKVVKLNTEIDNVKTKVAAIAEGIKNGNYNVNDDTIMTIIKAAQAANAATAGFNPYSMYIEIGLGVLAFILGSRYRVGHCQSVSVARLHGNWRIRRQ
jgi:anti-sigma28 factor (negative regulator of flagellin synthesis)